MILKKNLITNPSTRKIISKIKIKSYDDEATDFQDIKMRDIGSNYICLAVILIDLVLKKDENYYLQAFF